MPSFKAHSDSLNRSSYGDNSANYHPPLHIIDHVLTAAHTLYWPHSVSISYCIYFQLVYNVGIAGWQWLMVQYGWVTQAAVLKGFNQQSRLLSVGRVQSQWVRTMNGSDVFQTIIPADINVCEGLSMRLWESHCTYIALVYISLIVSVGAPADITNKFYISILVASLPVMWGSDVWEREVYTFICMLTRALALINSLTTSTLPCPAAIKRAVAPLCGRAETHSQLILYQGNAHCVAIWCCVDVLCSSGRSNYTSSLHLLTCALASTSSLTTSTCPLNDALISGVQPSCEWDTD